MTFCLYRLLVFLLFAYDEFLLFEIIINEHQAQLSQRDARRAMSVEIYQLLHNCTKNPVCKDLQ